MKFVIYKDTADEWRWSLRSRNGRIIADSAEGYTRRSSCVRAAKRVRRAASKAKIVAE